MKFQLLDCPARNDSAIGYYRSELSFGMAIPASAIGAVVTISFLQLELSETGVIVALTGYCPKSNWVKRRLTHQAAPIGAVRYLGEPILPGTGVEILGSHKWPIYYDARAKWVKVQGPTECVDGREVFAGVQIMLDQDHQIAEIWIPYHPI